MMIIVGNNDKDLVINDKDLVINDKGRVNNDKDCGKQ